MLLPHLSRYKRLRLQERLDPCSRVNCITILKDLNARCLDLASRLFIINAPTADSVRMVLLCARLVEVVLPDFATRAWTAAHITNRGNEHPMFDITFSYVGTSQMTVLEGTRTSLGNQQSN